MNLVSLRPSGASFRRLAVLSTGLVGTGVVMAQAADPFQAAMTTATANVGTYAAALVGLGAVAVVFMIALKYVKKIPRAS